MAIKVPDVRQEFAHSCGPACAEAVAAAFGKPRPHVRCSTRTGATAAAMADGLESVGLVTQIGQMDEADVRHHLRRGRLVVCLVVLSTGEGHYVVVSAVARGRVKLHDPETGPRSEPLAEFLAKWQGDRWAVAAGLG